jgi:S-adenosylmethionine decarboxylase
VQALGRHLLLELFDCDADALNSLETVKAAMVEAAKRAQATIVDVVFHEFNPFGISGVVVIAESHLAIHTWPEYRYAAVDVFSCGDVLQPQTAANYLVEQLGACRASVVELQRGIFLQAAAMPHKPAGAKMPVAKVPVTKVPVAKVPVARAPVAKVPVVKVPVAKVPLAKVPVAKVPVGG